MLRVADPQVAVTRPGHSSAKSAKLGDRLQITLRRDPVDLACLAACPQMARIVERQAFGMIEPVCEDFESLNRNFRHRFAGQADILLQK